MTAYPDRAGRYAVVGFALGVLSILTLLVAYSFGIVHRPRGLEGRGALLSVAAVLVSPIGSLLSFWGCSSPTRRGLAVAGLVLSLAAALVILGYWILTYIDFSQAHSSGLGSAHSYCASLLDTLSPPAG
jgi:hypothetical protein